MTKEIKQNPKIAVLLATFNGGKYIAQQLDSLLAQEFKGFELYISDDGSSDNTMEIVNSYAEQFSGRMHIIEKRKRPENSLENAACANFLYLLETVQSDLYLFCDQDDFWLENHISLLVEKYNVLNEDEKRSPVLVYTDLSIVDSELNIIHHSDSTYMKRKINQNKHSYFFSTGIRGCACMVNENLKKIAFQNKEILQENMEKIEMHDIFVALIASFFGNIYFINVPTLLYRQHESNTSGGIAKKRTLKQMIKKGISFSRYKESYKVLKKDFIRKQLYAEFFADYFNDMLSKREQKIMNGFVSLSERNKFLRICFLIKNRFFKKGLVNNIWQFIVV